MSRANSHNDLQKSGKYSTPAEIRAETRRGAEIKLNGLIVKIARGERRVLKEMVDYIRDAERKGLRLDDYKDMCAELFLDRRIIYGLGHEDSTISPIARA